MHSAEPKAIIPWIAAFVNIRAVKNQVPSPLTFVQSSCILYNLSVSYETGVISVIYALPGEQLQILCNCRLFQGLDTQWLLSALDDTRCRCQSYPKGMLICGGRQFERALGILLSGQIRVMRTNHDGRQMPVSIQLAGAIFGMAVLFCDAEAFPTELYSDSRCEVLYIQESLLRELMRQQFQIAENYIRYLSGRILFLNRKIAGLSAGDSTHKLAQWLLDHADGTQAMLPAMVHLAQELNLGRASLYRAMEALETAGAIRREGKLIHIDDPLQLQTLHHDLALD